MGLGRAIVSWLVASFFCGRWQRDGSAAIVASMIGVRPRCLCLQPDRRLDAHSGLVQKYLPLTHQTARSDLRDVTPCLPVGIGVPATGQTEVYGEAYEVLVSTCFHDE